MSDAPYHYHRETLNNGLQLLWLDIPHVHSASLAAYVRAGSVYETKPTNGVSHLLEHLHCMILPGHSSRLETLRALDVIPGVFNAQTNTDFVTFFFESAPAELVRCADLLSQILQVRSYPPEAMESERRLLLNEIAPSEQDQDHDLHFAEELFGDHPFALPVGGTLPSLSRLTSDQIQEFDRRSFDPSRIIVIAVGPSISEQKAALREHLGRLERQSVEPLDLPTLPPMKLPHIQRVRPKTPQRRVMLGFLFDGLASRRDRIALHMLWMGLNAISCPLFEKLRYTGGSTYDFYADWYRFGRLRLACVCGLTARSDRDSFIENTLAELASIRRGDSIPIWFETVRQKYHHFVEQAKDQPAVLAHRIGDEELTENADQMMTIEDELSVLNGLQPGDIQDVAGRLLRRDNFFMFFDGLRRWFDTRRVEKLVHRLTDTTSP